MIWISFQIGQTIDLKPGWTVVFCLLTYDYLTLIFECFSVRFLLLFCYFIDFTHLLGIKCRWYSSFVEIIWLPKVCMNVFIFLTATIKMICPCWITLERDVMHGRMGKCNFSGSWMEIHCIIYRKMINVALMGIVTVTSHKIAAGHREQQQKIILGLIDQQIQHLEKKTKNSMSWCKHKRAC